MAINLVNDNISTIEIQGKKYNIKAIPFHGTAAEWENNNYIPKDGEIIIYDIDENYSYKRIKIGDGNNTATNLSFLDEDITSRILELETTVQDLDNVAYIDPTDNENVLDPDISASEITIDGAMSTTSTNPVQNKVITQIINSMTLKKHTDGLIYIFINDKPVGEGVEFYPNSDGNNLTFTDDGNGNVVIGD